MVTTLLDTVHGCAEQLSGKLLEAQTSDQQCVASSLVTSIVSPDNCPAAMSRSRFQLCDAFECMQRRTWTEKATCPYS